jgi:hypothetical protein
MIQESYCAYAHSINGKLINGVYLPNSGERPRRDLTLAIKDVRHALKQQKRQERV